MKKVTGLTAKKHNASKVKISWKNINGESGYQVRRQVKKGNVYVTRKTFNTSAASGLHAAPKGTIFYYQIRAYKTVNGTKVYAP